jgi:3',5'-cyclic AMP phosphodiesterase CpdA
VQRICYAVRPFGDDVVKILVAHHPFDPSPARDARAQSGNVEALQVLSDAGIDVFLTGHLHVSSVAHSASRYNLGGRSALIVEAGTATSTRLRESTNAFNVLHVATDSIVVERHDWAPEGFRAADVQSFVRTPAGWLDAPAAAPPLR